MTEWPLWRAFRSCGGRPFYTTFLTSPHLTPPPSNSNGPKPFETAGSSAPIASDGTFVFEGWWANPTFDVLTPFVHGVVWPGTTGSCRRAARARAHSKPPRHPQSRSALALRSSASPRACRTSCSPHPLRTCVTPFAPPLHPPTAVTRPPPASAQVRLARPNAIVITSFTVPPLSLNSSDDGAIQATFAGLPLSPRAEYPGGYEVLVYSANVTAGAVTTFTGPLPGCAPSAAFSLDAQTPTESAAGTASITILQEQWAANWCERGCTPSSEALSPHPPPPLTPQPHVPLS